MKRIFIFLVIIFVVVLSTGGFLGYRYYQNKKKSSISQTSTPSVQTPVPSPTDSNSSSQNQNALASPIDQFKERITKKPFGIYVTPQNSPISPEHFTGYHTGADAEYEDVSNDVPVYAVADGKVVLSETASGYGGVFMIEIALNGTTHTILYGHIRPSSLPKVGQTVTKGEQLAVLGTGYSSETDGERRHLHFAVLSDSRIDIKGYVQVQSQLSGWIDPLTLY